MSDSGHTIAWDVRFLGNGTIHNANGARVASIVNLGDVVSIDGSHELDPDGAMALGRALMTWSSWKRRVIPTLTHWDNPKEGES